MTNNNSDWYADKLTPSDLNDYNSEWYLQVDYSGISSPLHIGCRDKRNATHKYLRYTADRRTEKIKIYRKGKDYTETLESFIADTICSE